MVMFSPPSTLKRIGISSAPRSGSTWLFHVVEAALSKKGVEVIAEHWPFLDRITAPGPSDYTIALKRDAGASYASYLRLYTGRGIPAPLNSSEFRERWTAHYLWHETHGSHLVWYEAIEKDPRRALGEELYMLLAPGFLAWPHVAWSK